MNESFSTVKYVAKFNLNVNGVVEKPDVVGAIFGQLEGFLGRELDLRELQRTGRIGRIDVFLQSKGGKTKGTIVIPSSLGKTETAIIAAAVEMVDKIGPCLAQIKLEEIVDVRQEKKNLIKKRAIEILEQWEKKEKVKIENLLQEIEDSIRTREIISYGPEKLPAGPDIENSNEIIVVEGRADVINLLKHGIRNTVAVEGTSIPKTVQEITKRKRTTAFLDGDRGGELILKELLQVASVDYVAFAPPGKMVEELSEKEIISCLKNRIPIDQYLKQKGKTQLKALTEKRFKGGKPTHLNKLIEKTVGTFKLFCLNKNFHILKEIPIEPDEIEKAVNETKPAAIFIDGIITQRLVNLAAQNSVKLVAGVKKGDLTKIPYPLKIYTFDEIVSRNLDLKLE